MTSKNLNQKFDQIGILTLNKNKQSKNAGSVIMSEFFQRKRRLHIWLNNFENLLVCLCHLQVSSLLVLPYL